MVDSCLSPKLHFTTVLHVLNAEQHYETHIHWF